MMWIAIVDMDQPGRRAAVVLENENDEAAIFSSPDEIRELRKDHILGVFHWWLFNVETGEVDD